MASQVDICNLALSHLSCGAIQSLSDGSESARLLQLHYDRCRQSVLRDFPWSFSRITNTLALTTFTIPAWDYCYAYPLKCLKIIRVFDSRYREKEEFEIRLSPDGTTKMIVTDVKDAYAEYIFDMEDTTLYDSLFIEALSYKIAFELNHVKTSDAALAQELLQRYQLTLSTAQHSTAVEENKHIEYPNRYLEARRGYPWRHRR